MKPEQPHPTTRRLIFNQRQHRENASVATTQYPPLSNRPTTSMSLPQTAVRCCHFQNLRALCPMAAQCRPRDDSPPPSPPTYQTPTISQLGSQFRATSPRLDSTPASKSIIIGKNMSKRTMGTPRCLDVESGARQAHPAAPQRGCVWVPRSRQVMERMPMPVKDSLFVSHQQFLCSKTQATATGSLQLESSRGLFFGFSFSHNKLCPPVCLYHHYQQLPTGL